jgi:hypothetical protein
MIEVRHEDDRAYRAVLNTAKAERRIVKCVPIRRNEPLESILRDEDGRGVPWGYLAEPLGGPVRLKCTAYVPDNGRDNARR